MMARLALAGRRRFADAMDAADALAVRFCAFTGRWLSDAHVREHEPEFWLAFRQVIFIGVPSVLIGIGLMAVLP